MAEEIDLEKCTFRNFGSSVTLTLDRVEVTLVRICGRGLPTRQIRSKSEKLCGRTDGRTDTPEFQSTRSLPGDDLKISFYNMQLKTIWLYCVECPQYSTWLEALGCLYNCLSGRVQRYITSGQSNLI